MPKLGWKSTFKTGLLGDDMIQSQGELGYWRDSICRVRTFRSDVDVEAAMLTDKDSCDCTIQSFEDN